MPEEPFPVSSTALASSRLGACFLLIAYHADHPQQHGYSEESAPAALIGIDKLFYPIPGFSCSPRRTIQSSENIAAKATRKR